jgi:hypothetical protein
MLRSPLPLRSCSCSTDVVGSLFVPCCDQNPRVAAGDDRPRASGDGVAQGTGPEPQEVCRFPDISPASTVQPHGLSSPKDYGIDPLLDFGQQDFGQLMMGTPLDLLLAPALKTLWILRYCRACRFRR